MPLVQRLHDRYGKRGLKTIAIASVSREKVAREMRRRRYDFGAGVDTSGVTQRRWKIGKYPVTFIVGCDGKVKPLVGGRWSTTIESELKKMK